MRGWSRAERRWRDQIFAAMIPAGERGLPGLGELDLTGFWETVSSQAPPLLRLGLRVAVWFVYLSPPLLLIAPRTFGGLTGRDRGGVLERLAASRWYLLRQLVSTLKALACLAYFADGRVRALVGEGAGAR